MFLVDTSVWIHALRRTGCPAIRDLLRPLIVEDQTAITEWILLELMTGLSRSEQKDDLIRRFAPITNLSFEAAWWNQAWEYAACLRKRGISTTASDCFIATVALQHKVVLIHCHADFELIASILPLQTKDWSKYLPGSLPESGRHK
jgi:predicted nucleic acid-binding protein